MLNYERLDVYQCGLKLAGLSFRIVERLPQGNAELSDQLKRAAISILLNIAEGAGKVTDRDRARFYSIARGSAMECAASLDILHLLELIDTRQATEGKELAERIVSMLSKLRSAQT